MKRSKNIITMSYESLEYHLNCNNLQLLHFQNKFKLLTEVLKSIAKEMDKSEHLESVVPSMVANHVDEIFKDLSMKESKNAS